MLLTQGPGACPSVRSPAPGLAPVRQVRARGVGK